MIKRHVLVIITAIIVKYERKTIENSNFTLHTNILTLNNNPCFYINLTVEFIHTPITFLFIQQYVGYNVFFTHTICTVGMNTKQYLCFINNHFTTCL